MAKSRFEYVRNFEQVDSLLKNAWIVVRIDGRSFHRFSTDHAFTKPNDIRGLNLMNACAVQVMSDFQDVVLAYGHSDEYSFVIDRKSSFYQRRSSKILSTIVSIFSSSYVIKWPEHFAGQPLKSVPTFDGRIVLYPSDENLKDYFRWRQADCHINNLYNTTFWALIQQGNQTNTEAEHTLMGTDSGDKNDILFSRFGVNYNNEPAMFRKGSIVLRFEANQPARLKQPRIIHDDLIRSEFWDTFYPHLLQ